MLGTRKQPRTSLTLMSKTELKLKEGKKANQPNRGNIYKTEASTTSTNTGFGPHTHVVEGKKQILECS